MGAGGERKGPFTEKIIASMVDDHTIVRETLIWKKGMAEWKKAEEVEELKELFNALPPPLP